MCLADVLDLILDRDRRIQITFLFVSEASIMMHWSTLMCNPVGAQNLS